MTAFRQADVLLYTNYRLHVYIPPRPIVSRNWFASFIWLNQTKNLSKQINQLGPRIEPEAHVWDWDS